MNSHHNALMGATQPLPEPKPPPAQSAALNLSGVPYVFVQDSLPGAILLCQAQPQLQALFDG